MTTLVVPPAMKAEINPTSGFLGPKYSHKTVKGLFLSPENVKYLGDQIISVLSHVPFVLNNLPYNDDAFAALTAEDRERRAQDISQAFMHNAAFIRSMVPAYIRAHDDPIMRAYREDQTIPNPVIALHQQNLELIEQVTRNLVHSPQQIDPSLTYLNPERGAAAVQRDGRAPPRAQYDYDAESWQDGTWHPEHLFTRSERNDANPYWVPMEVNISSASGDRDRAPGHRYLSDVYGRDERTSRRIGRGVSSSQFPRWQYSNQDRSGISRTAQGYDEAAEGDRRVQGARGYQMGDLVARSSY